MIIPCGFIVESKAERTLAVFLMCGGFPHKFKRTRNTGKHDANFPIEVEVSEHTYVGNQREIEEIALI